METLAFSVTIHQPMNIPPFPVSMLRGVLGHALKARYGCSSGTCGHCLYCRVFEGRSNDLLAKGVKTPPPMFSMRVTSPPGLTQRIEGQLTLFGEACQFKHEIIHALDLGLFRGLGPCRVPAQLTEVLALPLLARPVSNDCQLTLITPLQIKTKGKLIGTNSLTSKDLLFSIARRGNLLAELYRVPFPRVHFSELAEHCQSIPCTTSMKMAHWQRYSNRQGRTNPLSGLIGTINLSIPSHLRATILPILTAGQWLHAGSKTAFGLGAYQLSSHSSIRNPA